MSNRVVFLVASFFQLLTLTTPQNGTWFDRYYWGSLTGTTPELIQLRGFKPENHTVITPDGYVIQIFRIINQNRTRRGYPLIVFNGLLLASEAYLDNSDGFFNSQTGVYTEFELNFRTAFQLLCPPGVFPLNAGRNLPFTLATCGFDVWLPNVRDAFGYSSHLYLDQQKDSQYWNINLDSYSVDAKSIIDYVLKKTGTGTLGALCHSVSCNTLFQVLADNSPYNDILKPVISLAPFIYTEHVASIPLTLPALAVPLLNNLLMSTPDFRSLRPLYADNVRRSPLLRFITLFLFSFVGGINIEEMDLYRAYRIPAHFPANVAFRVFAHIGQRRLVSGKSNLLPKYDYGSAGNVKVYGQPVPAVYDFRKVTNPYLVVFRGLNDILADSQDIDRLKAVLTVPLMAEIQTSYSHTDFVFGRTVNVTVILPILRILHQMQLNYN